MGGQTPRQSCCSYCGNWPFCSPVSGRCYGNQAKSYYQVCASQAPPRPIAWQPTRCVPTSGTVPGGDVDEHCCKPSAGFSWCETLQKCVQGWDTPCPPSAPVVRQYR